MRSTKTFLAAASLALVTAVSAGAAHADPWDHHSRPFMRHEMRDLRYDNDRRMMDRERAMATLRMHHYRWFGEPGFVRGHYGVRAIGRNGRPYFVEINPYTGALIGEFRI